MWLVTYAGHFQFIMIYDTFYDRLMVFAILAKIMFFFS